MIGPIEPESCGTPSSTSHDQDELNLALFEQLLDRVRDRVGSVARGYQNGAYLVGPPGSGKTFAVMEELNRLDRPHIKKNGRVTAPGLFHLLQKYREYVVVLDDIPSLLAERSALQILLAALGGEPGEPRLVTYTTAEMDGHRSFHFDGGIIAISNVPLRRDPLADAIASRVPVLEHVPSDDMIAAFMRAEARKGNGTLSVKERLMVVEFVIKTSRDCEYPLDLRYMKRGWCDYAFAKHGHARRPWKEMIQTGMKKMVLPTPKSVMTQAQKVAEELDLAREIRARFPGRNDKRQRDEEWCRRTGKSVDTLYRRLRELDSQEPR